MASENVTAVALNESSVIDLTAQVNTLSLHWSAPAQGKEWRLFALWEGFTNQKSCSGAPNATSSIVNGSWVVDHFSEAGAELHTSFFEDNILAGSNTKEKLRDAGGYGKYSLTAASNFRLTPSIAWEDSIEMQFALPWTPGLLEKFELDHNYSLVKYLPLLFSKANSWSSAVAPYSETFSYGSNSSEGEEIHSANYRTTLGNCYQAYLAHHTSWAESLGVGFSTQPSYNLPLSFVSANAQHVLCHLEPG